MEKEKSPVKQGGNNKCVCKAAVIEVIVTESVVGSGSDADPIRKIVQYWSFEGELLAVSDPISRYGKIV
ncbi:hypothetical protein [Phascolarctobacterium faecium]|uniref:hypothetical protein n=1 Tax=Phascolarctobacterium faecium TaxID=33025 RepID=UPI0026735849|nr:hypothetical protein [Phascolarctobacterium faecium]